MAETKLMGSGLNAVQLRGFTQRRKDAKSFKLLDFASFASWRENSFLSGSRLSEQY
jgi:hypothetical protein